MLLEQDLLKIEVKMFVELQPSEGLTGARESTSKVAHLHAQRVRAGCWLESSVSYHMDLCIGLLEYPQNMAAGFHQN